MKDWEVQINDHLKHEGIGPITILYGNKIYPKTLIIQVALKLGMCGLLMKINLFHSYGWSKLTQL